MVPDARRRGRRPSWSVATAAWHVPFRWLTAFDDAERTLTAERLSPRLGPTSLAGQRAAVPIRHETDLAVGMARAAARPRHPGGGEPGREHRHARRRAGGLDVELPRRLDPGSQLLRVSRASSPSRSLEADRSVEEMWACLEAMELDDVDEIRHPVLGLGRLVGADLGRRTGELSTPGQRFWQYLLSEWGQSAWGQSGRRKLHLTLDSQTKRC